jgi:N-acetylglucosamine kinase-like BadF-type ATPase
MKEYVVGVDGGGTKTSVTIASLNGTVVDTFQSGAININGESLKNVHENFRDIFTNIKQKCGGVEVCAAICIGTAGISNPAVKQFLTEAAAANGYTGRFIITGDHQTAFYGALGKPCGAILIAGTGSVCYGKNADGEEHRTGGFGHLIDDEGSGYAIGRDILSAIVQEYDGRGKSTALTDMVYRQLDCSSVQELIGFVYNKATNKRDIAALSPSLTAACEAGDEVAWGIAKRCARELKKLTLPVIEKLGLQRESLAVAGSILLKDAYIKDEFCKIMQSEFQGLTIHSPKHDAAYGGVLIALESLC